MLKKTEKSAGDLVEGAKSSQKKTSFKRRLTRLRPTKRNLERSEKIATRHARKFIVGRLDSLRAVKRETVGWAALVGFLIVLAVAQSGIYGSQNLNLAGSDGGTYAEGVVGDIGTLNPLYAGTDNEKAASSLIYSSLFDYDDSGQIKPELAESYSISEGGKVYIVKLRDNVRWSDGDSFNADDVLLTVNLIKDPEAGSVLESSWKTVEIVKIDDMTVKFTLKNSFSSFPFALTFGILPNHVLNSVSSSNLRSFFVDNIDKIIGTGAFVYRSNESLSDGHSRIHLLANEDYFQGKPRLKSFDIRTYATSQDLLNGFNNKEINAASGLDVSDAKKSISIHNSNLIQSPMADGVFVLFNNSGTITSSKAVREALRLGADRDALRSAAVSGGGSGEKLSIPLPMETPILSSSVKGMSSLKQPDYDYNAAANKLDSEGWKLNSQNQREKDGQTMKLNMVTVKGSDYEKVAKSLAEQWRKLGVQVELEIVDAGVIQQSYLVTRNYDVLVYQIHIGADPDVFAYWGASQATSRGLNLANYKSTLSDLSLSSARSQLDRARRDVKYIDFAERWIANVPAIALYQPNFYYLKSSSSRSLTSDYEIVDAASRYSNVQNWTVQMKQLKKTP